MITPDESLIDTALERKMELAQRIVSLSRSLREKSKIRVRQPLKRILIPVINPEDRRDIQYFDGIIKEELNVKEIEFVSGASDIVKKSAKPDFKVIGKKYGKLTQHVANAIKDMTENDVAEFERNAKFSVAIDGQQLELDKEDIEIVSEDIEGWLVATDNSLTVALDTHIDDQLKKEGVAREFVNRIQNIRKQSGFEVTDRVDIAYNAPDEIAGAITSLADYIKNETLAESIVLADFNDGATIDIDDVEICVHVTKK